MKAALLSFHNAYNYGAALQAYGLQYAVEQMGVECEYIDYRNARRIFSYDMNQQIKAELGKKNFPRVVKLICGKPFIESRGRKFDVFYKKYLKTTKKIYHNSEEASELNPLYDKFVVGSDQVWNYGNNGADFAYLLDFVKDSEKKISYASSFGLNRIPQEYRESYSSNLAEFDRIGVREQQGVALVEELTGRTPHLVLDPVFLAGRDCFNQLRDTTVKTKKKYIFFYTNRSCQVEDFLKTGFVKEKYKYHILSTHVTPKDFLNPRIEICVSMSPERFLQEIHEAEFVVTASFHCLVLAIMFHKPFCAILTGDSGKDERLVSLLKLIGQESRILTRSLRPDELRKEIDYEEVERRLKPYYEHSYEYLRRALYSKKDIPVVENRNIRFCNDSRCTGCTACEEVCPTDAVRLCKDEEGFLYPVADEDRCIQCGRCSEVCQIVGKAENLNDKQVIYAVKNNDEIRMKSSSGGMFRALAAEIFKENGIVCAAGMTKEFTVRHLFAENEDELKPMCGTYYVQSDLRGIFKRIRTSLKEGRKVLFVGTPCQVQGLNCYLGEKPGNLLTCDIICHGVPSPEVFASFLDELKRRGELSEFRFRDKRTGWRGYHVSAVLDGKTIKDKLWLQSFNVLFSHNVINRRSCSDCRYTSFERYSDITIGDYWGVNKHHPDLDDNLGVSLVLCNSDKGRAMFERLSGLTVREILREEALQNSLKQPAKVSSSRYAFYRTLDSDGYMAAAKKYGECNKKGLVKKFARKIMR